MKYTVQTDARHTISVQVGKGNNVVLTFHGNPPVEQQIRESLRNRFKAVKLFRDGDGKQYVDMYVDDSNNGGSLMRVMSIPVSDYHELLNIGLNETQGCDDRKVIARVLDIIT